MWAALAFGFLLGLSLAAPPGPMNALIAKEASRHGFGHGVKAGVGAPVADVLWLLAMYVGFGRLFEGGRFVTAAAGVGAVVMTVFAYQAWEQRAPRAADRPATFWAFLLAALTNPYQAAWWLSGGFVFVQSQGAAGIPGFLLGIFGWVLVFAFLVAHGADRWTWFGPVVRYASAGLLGFFAVVLALVAMGIVVV